MKNDGAEDPKGASWWWGAGALLVVAVLVFGRSLSPNLTMAQGDVSNVGMRYAYGALPSGLWANWHPLEGMGMPTSPLMLAPSTLIGWGAPSSKIVDISYIFHIVVFGLGGFLLLRDLTRSTAAATVGGLWFMLQPHAFTHIQPGHLGFFWMCAWMPWCLYFLRRAVHDGNPCWWVLAGASGGLTLTGALDIGMLFLLFTVCYGAFLVCREGVNWRARGGNMWRYCAAVVFKGCLAGVAVLLVGFQIVVGSGVLDGASSTSAPGVEAKPAAEAAREQYLWATQWSIPVAEALDFVIPGLFGWGSSDRANPYRGGIGQTEGFPQHGKGLPNLNDINNYLGAVMVLGCVVAVVARRRSMEVWVLVAAVLVACLLAFGKHAPFYRMFYELPFMSSMRNPIKWFAIASLCVGMLGTIGLAEVMTKGTAMAGTSLAKRVALCFLPGVLVVAAGALFLSNIGSGPEWMFWRDKRSVALAWDSVRAAALFWALAGGLFLWAMRDRARGPAAGTGRSVVDRFFPVIAGALVLGEVLYVDLRYLPYNPTDIPRGDTVVEFLNAQKPPFRIMLTRMDGVYRYINDVFCPYYGWERPAIAVTRTEDAVSVFMRRIGRDARNTKKMLQLMNVHYLLSPNRFADPDFVPVASVMYGSTPVIVQKFTNALPRYYVVSNWEVVAEDKALDRMAAPEFDPRGSVLIHGNPDAVPPLPTSPVDAVCEITAYTRGGATMRTRASQPAVLVGLERYDKSWAVFVDGKRVPVLKANWMLRACSIPAGEHVVEWKLVGGALGFWLGIAGWVVVALAGACLAIGGWMARRRA